LLRDDKLFAIENMRVDTYAYRKDQPGARLRLDHDEGINMSSASIALGLRIQWSCGSWYADLRGVMCSLFEGSKFKLQKWGVLEEDEDGALVTHMEHQEMRFRMVEAYFAERIRNMILWAGGPYHYAKLASPHDADVKECLGYYSHLWPQFLKYQAEVAKEDC
jgi:hypothetical protein